jgi:hypothetical protein
LIVDERVHWVQDHCSNGWRSAERWSAPSRFSSKLSKDRKQETFRLARSSASHNYQTSAIDEGQFRGQSLVLVGGIVDEQA